MFVGTLYSNYNYLNCNISDIILILLSAFETPFFTLRDLSLKFIINLVNYNIVVLKYIIFHDYDIKDVI